MAELKTKPNDASVETFLNGIEDETKRKDSFTILEMMKQITGAQPKMWGENIIGFGDTHYTYATGREGDWFKVGFSPRKQNLTLYLGTNALNYADLLSKLGKHKLGKGCLYINKLSDVDMTTLKEIVTHHVNKA